MKTHGIKLLGRFVASGLLATMLLGAGLPVAAADERDKCRHEIEKKENKLDEAVRKHGEHSHQAEDRRRDLFAERERCWSAHHGWWDGHEHRWHDERWEDRH